MRSWIPVAAALPILLAGCSSSAPDAAHVSSAAPSHAATQLAAAPRASNASLAHFRSSAFGFRLDYPKGMLEQRSFTGGYISNDAWKAYASPDSKGTPVVALILPGSDDVSRAALRIGASRDPQSVNDCLKAPSTARGASGTRSIHGARFTYFEAGDAAMNHYMHTHSYRLVHDGACIAIDLMVTGTNPQVYDPPRKPPFTQDDAFARLQQALRGFHFTL
ncbi:hypothetical protein [Oleiagrimonas soli]|nr:hypothetical protein [Oleiagrimonas soli]MBB6182806.1 hypothetical protein [Oleiagrimonas soli]